MFRATTACRFLTPQLLKVLVRLTFFLCLSLPNVLRAPTACTFSTSQPPKRKWEWYILNIYISKYASCHNSVYISNSLTSKKGPNLMGFENMLRARTVRHFSSLIWPASSAPAALASLLFGPTELQKIGKLL